MLDKRKHSPDTGSDTPKESELATNPVPKPKRVTDPKILERIDHKKIEEAIADSQRGRTVSREEALESLLEHA